VAEVGLDLPAPAEQLGDLGGGINGRVQERRRQGHQPRSVTAPANRVAQLAHHQGRREAGVGLGREPARPALRLVIDHELVMPAQTHQPARTRPPFLAPLPRPGGRRLPTRAEVDDLLLVHPKNAEDLSGFEQSQVGERAERPVADQYVAGG